MSVYMLNYGRPIGVEPKIYLEKPVLPVIPEEDRSPWDPVIEEHENEFTARLYYRESYPSRYHELTVVKKYDTETLDQQ